MEASEILFVGETPDSSFYHRVLLPAAALGCDWCGFDCVYEPGVVAIHYESLFRSRPDEKVQRWQMMSYARLREKWASVPLADIAPGLS